MDSAMLTATKAIPDVTRIEAFSGSNFKRWQTKILLVLDIAKVDFVLTKPKPEKPKEGDQTEYEKELSFWENANKICKSILLNALSNELFDVYCLMKDAVEIWNALNRKYIVEDAGTKKYAIENFLNFQMSEEKDVSMQIHEYHLVVSELGKEGMLLPEPFVVGALIEKLPESWKDYKNTMKHKKKDMNLEEVIVHIRIEEKNRMHDQTEKAKELATKANLVEGNNRNNVNRQHGNSNGGRNYGFKHNNNNRGGSNNNNNRGGSNNFNNNKNGHLKAHNQIGKKKGNCFVCGKPGHHAAQCRHRKRNDTSNPPNANLAEADVIVAVVSEVNMVAHDNNWVVDSGATKHICGIKNAFSSYTPLGEGEERVYMGDSTPAPVLGKGKVLIRLTSGKILSLTDVLHVPTIRRNLVSVSLLGKVGIKVIFESDKIVMTKNGVFVGKGYNNNGLFVLNVSNIVNENASSSAYLLECDSLWHARLGHVNYSYIKQMKEIGILKNISISEHDKCHTCAEAKITKKPCKPVLERESDLLNLIHSDLGDLKSIMTRGGKKYYVTFIDDFSRYTKVYLLRHKNEAFDMFVKYKAEVENKLDRKIKRLRSDRCGEYEHLNDFCKEHGIVHETTPPYSP